MVAFESFEFSFWDQIRTFLPFRSKKVSFDVSSELIHGDTKFYESIRPWCLQKEILKIWEKIIKGSIVIWIPMVCHMGLNYYSRFLPKTRFSKRDLYLRSEYFIAISSGCRCSISQSSHFLQSLPYFYEEKTQFRVSEA